VRNYSTDTLTLACHDVVYHRLDKIKKKQKTDSVLLIYANNSASSNPLHRTAPSQELSCSNRGFSEFIPVRLQLEHVTVLYRTEG